MKLPTMKTKKINIKSVQNDLAIALERLEEKKEQCSSQWDRAETAEKKIKSLEWELNGANHAAFRNREETVRLLGLMAEYSLALANPDTAKDTQRLVVLQAKIAGTHVEERKNMLYGMPTGWNP